VNYFLLSATMILWFASAFYGCLISAHKEDFFPTGEIPLWYDAIMGVAFFGVLGGGGYAFFLFAWWKALILILFCAFMGNVIYESSAIRPERAIRTGTKFSIAGAVVFIASLRAVHEAVGQIFG